LRRAALLCFLALLAAQGAWAADAPTAAAASAPAATAPAAAPAPAKDAPAAKAEDPEAAAAAAAAKLESSRRDSIRYGIDSEIGDLIQKLASEKDGRYNEDLLALLGSSRSPKLRGSVLDFFASLEWAGAESLALSLVGDRDNADQDLVYSALSYLAAIKSKEAVKLSGDLIKEDNKKLLPALVRLMGRAGGDAEEKLLLDWLEGDTATPALKEEAIKALGEIGSSAAAEKLGKLVEDTAGGKAARMYACAALAKIKDESSIPGLVKASIDADPNVRTSALTALGAFAGGSSAASEEARGALVQGLRDSYANARIAACKAAASGKVTAALAFLRYKAKSDPEKAVKTEACRSLAILGGDSYAFLREMLEDKKTEASLRVLLYGLLARYDAASSMGALESMLKAEAIEKDRSFYTSLAREVANADQAPLIAPLARILASDKEYLIRIAAIEWARKTKSQEFKPDLERLSKDDPSDMIKKRAAEALKAY
jgi:HEAT repeat protein